MININATIIIQTGNFFIVYWLLRYFLFRPVVTIIDHEHAAKASMLTIIDQQKKSLDIQEKERKRNWFMCQEYFSTHRPRLDTIESFVSEVSDIECVAPHVSADIIKGLVADSYILLEGKIKNVH